MRKQTDYNKIVGIKDGAVYVLNYVFENGDFKGATGFTMRPISQDYIDQRWDKDYLEDTYREVWKDSVACGNTEDSFADFLQNIIEETELNSELLYPTDDPSFRFEFEEILEGAPAKIKARVNEIKTLANGVEWECESCGRIFGDSQFWHEFEVLEPELVAAIRAKE